MNIKKITWQYRRDFDAILECEGCMGTQKLELGYEDCNYHDNVIPALKCKHCGKSRNDLGIVENTATPTKYAPHEIV